MKKNEFKKSDWIKLDNAAIIYPTTLSKDYASMFRVWATLDSKVDPRILKMACENVIKRFPSFSYKLKRGLFWCYFKSIEGIPSIKIDYKNPMYRINFKDNNNFMFRVRYFDNRIALECFHALTDGYGGMSFLLSLVAEYNKIKNNIKPIYNHMILNPNDKPSSEEYSDNFTKFYREVSEMEKEKSAYHYKGELEDKHIIHLITGSINTNSIKTLAKKYDATITQYLVSVMILCLQQIQEKEIKNIKKRKPIKVSVPVDLRRLYNVNSMRNFSSYVNVGIEPKFGSYTFEEIINEVKSQFKLLTTEKRLNSKFSSNVKLEKNFLIRILPLFIKTPIINFVQNFIGDRYITQTFSNLGQINIDGELNNYINELGFCLGRSNKLAGSTACVGYKDKLFITFTRKIHESELERLFFTYLISQGLEIEIESNGGE